MTTSFPAATAALERLAATLDPREFATTLTAGAGAGSATILGDIPQSELVRDAWDSWNIDRKRAAIRAVLNTIEIHPLDPAAAPNAVARLKDPAKRQECILAMLRNRVDFDWRV